MGYWNVYLLIGIAGFGGKCRLLDLGMTWMMTRSFKLDADVWTMEADRVLKIDFFFV
ncbi:hypothetical protein HanLR1_Chr09g0308271 [Helianthus annuus]|nr:hypothetical protein HanHA89_Chr09g0328821 [Helianthus annuus]KAJ0706549.1 hypothetical protein HanLR1_Chr09g0308271 [Helianthus annuus]